MGRHVDRWRYYVHHDVDELPDGDLLVAVDKDGLSTIEDFALIVDRSSGDIVREIDLRTMMDVDRGDVGGDDEDWLHGPDPSERLLTGVDETGAPYGGGVQDGGERVPGFDWPSSQHAAMLTPMGSLLIFHNGVNRNFGTTEARYSRGVEYAVDEEAMTEVTPSGSVVFDAEIRFNTENDGNLVYGSERLLPPR